MSTRAHRIVVLGAGYAGLLGAIRLARRTRRHGGRVILVNPSERFVERLRMHQLAAGQHLADLRIPELVAGTGIEFVAGRAVRIDRAARTVVVATGDDDRQIRYDTLVYAIGAVADRARVPGVREHAYTLDGPATAARLADRLAGLAGGTVAVCGAGLTGVEAATEIAESHPEVRVLLLSRDVPGALMGEPARAYLHRALDRLGVQVRTGVEISAVLAGSVELADGERVAVDACLWTTGCVGHPLAAGSGLTVDGWGRAVVDDTLRSVSDPSVYVVGDAAAVRQPWGTVHGTCQSGIPTAVHAADSIVRRLRGRPARPFRFGYVHQPVSLGRRDAVIQFTRADDSPRRWYLTGRLAAAYKESVSSSPWPTYRMSRWMNAPVAALSRWSARTAPGHG